MNLNTFLFNSVNFVRNYLVRALYLSFGRKSSLCLNQGHLLAAVLVSLYPWCSLVIRHDKLLILKIISLLLVMVSTMIPITPLTGISNPLSMF